MDSVVILSFLFSITSLILSISAVLVNNYRNIIQRSAFNINRFKGSTNEKYWLKVISAFIIKNSKDIEEIKKFNLGNPADIENLAQLKYHLLLQKAMGGELKRETVIKCIEIAFEGELSQSYWDHKDSSKINDNLLDL